MPWVRTALQEVSFPLAAHDFASEHARQVLNELLLEWRSPIVTGFPEGPLNMPMFGNICKPWNPCDATYDPDNVPLVRGTALKVSHFRSYATGQGDMMLPAHSRRTLGVIGGDPAAITVELRWGHGTLKRIRIVAEDSLPKLPTPHEIRLAGRDPLLPNRAVAPPPANFTLAPGSGIRVLGVPRLGARRVNVTRTTTGTLKAMGNVKACFKSVLRDLVPHYYYRHKLYCGNSIQC